MLRPALLRGGISLGMARPQALARGVPSSRPGPSPAGLQPASVLTSGGAAVTSTAPSSYAILVTGHPPDPVIRRFGNYGHAFEQMLRENDREEWRHYLCVDGEFPTDAELASFDAVVITGSRHDAHGPEEWIERVRGLVRAAHAREQRMLGVCFGHQLLGNALGGRSGPAPDEVGWELGVKEISWAEGAASAVPALQGVAPSLNILQWHRDTVLQLPPGAQLVASSPRTPVEAYAIGSHVLCLQGHPEFSPDLVRGLLHDAVKHQRLTTKLAADALREVDGLEVSSPALRDLCLRFLKG